MPSLLRWAGKGILSLLNPTVLDCSPASGPHIYAKIPRALIPAQKQSAFSSRAVSTVTAHINAKTVKQSRRCLSECVGESVWDGCVRVRVHGEAQPDGHPTLTYSSSPLFSAQPSQPNPAPSPQSSQSRQGLAKKKGVSSSLTLPLCLKHMLPNGNQH